jgi:hypothetical protein
MQFKGGNMTKTRSNRGFALTLAAAFALLGLFGAGQAGAVTLKHFDGTVLSKNRQADTFRLRTESGREVKFRVNATTQFERIAGGFSGLHRGLRIEVDARRTDNGLLARHVQTRGGSGGGSGGGGADDGPNHT